MILEPRVCARDGCGVTFVPKAHNGLFCKPECRQISTNAKVLKRYYDGKKIKNGTLKRTCKTDDCDTILSRYNKENVCEHCKVNKFRKRLSGWGWSREQIEKKVEAMDF
jgi:hypothetical protein